MPQDISQEMDEAMRDARSKLGRPQLARRASSGHLRASDGATARRLPLLGRAASVGAASPRLSRPSLFGRGRLRLPKPPIWPLSMSRFAAIGGSPRSDKSTELGAYGVGRDVTLLNAQI